MRNLKYEVGQSVCYDPEGEGERVGKILTVETDKDIPFEYEVSDPEEPGNPWLIKEREILGLVQ